MPDEFYTPPDVAAQLVSVFRRKNERCIADFAAGDGELLLAAKTKWPKAEIIATDINSSSVRRLRALQPSWKVGKCNFLDEKSRRMTAALRDAIGKVSLVVLNPPFSCRGGQRQTVDFHNGVSVSSSRAMAFVLTAAQYLSSDGRIAAILPESCLYSKKDARAWVLLRELFKIKEHKTYCKRTFNGCAARTAIITLTTKVGSAKQHGRVTAVITCNKPKIRVKLVRGAMPVHRATNGLAGPVWPVVHTTNLRDSKVRDIHIWIREPHRHAAGPSVFLPRVGKPDFEKFVVYRGRQRLVLSDCVYALICQNTADAECLHRRLGDAWEEVVKKSYNGTCAPYLTIDRLLAVLSKVGCLVTDVDAVGYRATK